MTRNVLIDGHEADFVITHPSPEKISQRTVVLLIHPALGVAGAYYLKLAERLCARNNWVVAVQEQRGQGSSSWKASPDCDWSYWTPVSQDFDLHLDIIRKTYTQNPIVVIGHSVGAILWSLWLARAQLENNPRGSWISAGFHITCGNIYYKVHPARSLLAYSWLIAAVTWTLGWLPGEKVKFGGPAEAKSFMLDWCQTIWDGSIGSRECPHKHISHQFKHITIPLSFTTFDTDSFTPPACTEHLAKMFNPQYTSFEVIRASTEKEWQTMSGNEIHIRWARGTAILPYIERFVNGIVNGSIAKL